MKTSTTTMSMAETCIDIVRRERNSACFCCVIMLGMCMVLMFSLIHMSSKLKSEKDKANRTSGCWCMNALEVRISAKR